MATLFDRILEADVGIRPQVPVTPLVLCGRNISLDKFLHAVSNPS